MCPKRHFRENRILKFVVCSFRADNLDKDDKIKLRLELAAVCAHNAWSNCDFC